MKNSFDQITKQLQPLFTAHIYSDTTRMYFSHYGLNPAPDTIEHFFGSFTSQGYTLAAHVFVPQTYTATVILLHGFLAHTGQLKEVISFLLDKRYAVAVYDMPGHGLSSGNRGEIGGFTEYTRILDDFIHLTTPHLKTPYHIIGYSTGAATVIDYMLTTRTSLFGTVILCCPLIRSAMWYPSKWVYQVGKSFVSSIPRLPTKNSSDRKFLAFVRSNDPLQIWSVPVAWLNALYTWNRRIQHYPASDKKIAVIQGKKDSTLAWQYNLRFLGKKFPRADICTIPSARHELFNESPQIRTEVLSQVHTYLKRS